MTATKDAGAKQPTPQQRNAAIRRKATAFSAGVMLASFGLVAAAGMPGGGAQAAQSQVAAAVGAPLAQTALAPQTTRSAASAPAPAQVQVQPSLRQAPVAAQPARPSMGRSRTRQS